LILEIRTADSPSKINCCQSNTLPMAREMPYLCGKLNNLSF
jgi:hypothetical protein